jgi:hypothetical protein
VTSKISTRPDIKASKLYPQTNNRIRYHTLPVPTPLTPNQPTPTTQTSQWYKTLLPKSKPVYAQAIPNTRKSTIDLQPHIHHSTPHQPNRSKQSTFAFTTTNNSFPKQVQTPQQRRANEAFAKSEAAKRGKPQTEVERLAEKKKAAKLQAQKSPVSKVWLCKFFDFLSLLLVGMRSPKEENGQDQQEERKRGTRREGEKERQGSVADMDLRRLGSKRREEKKRRRLDRDKRSNKKGRNIYQNADILLKQTCSSSSSSAAWSSRPSDSSPASSRRTRSAEWITVEKRKELEKEPQPHKAALG